MLHCTDEQRPDTCIYLSLLRKMVAANLPMAAPEFLCGQLSQQCNKKEATFHLG